MNLKYFLGVLICVIPVAYTDEVQVVNGKIKISIGTGAFCGDTVSFIRDHLAPTYELYKEFLEVEFIPWGRASLTDDGEVVCERGHYDCWANRLHRCVLNILKSNQDAQVKYMTCEFTRRPAYLLGSYECAADIGVNLVEVDHCLNNPQMDDLDKTAAEAVSPAMAIIDFVPSIVFNDDINVELHEEARVRLRSMVCFALAEYPETGVSGCPIV